MLSVLNVNDSIDLKAGGGTAERTFQMSRFLAQQGVKCQVLTMESESPDLQRIEELEFVQVHQLHCVYRRFNIPKFDLKLIRHLVGQSDIIHLMGHWSLLNTLVYFVARKAGKPYVICPAGALPLFGRSVWLKRIFNLLVGNNIVRNASGWIAVTRGEFEHFETYGINASMVTVIPNGVSEDDFPLLDVTEFKLRRGLPDATIILFMGRLNSIKGPDLLLDAFVLARAAFPGAHLVFAGPDGGMLEALQNTIRKKKVTEFVHFLGFISGADKVAAYRMAHVLVVPSRQEAMSIVAVEAGFCGTPVLLTDQCGFSDIRLIDSRLEVPATVDGIATGLKALLFDKSVLDEISPVWSDFVKKQFSWPSLIPKYLNLYGTIITSQRGDLGMHGEKRQSDTSQK